jgi:inorganic triphosphatase YgiF
MDLDLGDCDGIQMRVRGDGQTFKMNIKTVGGEGGGRRGDK